MHCFLVGLGPTPCSLGCGRAWMRFSSDHVCKTQLGHPFLPRLHNTLASRSAAGQGFVPAAIAAMAFFLALLCLAPLCTLLMLVCSPTVLTNILSAKLVL